MAALGRTEGTLGESVPPILKLIAFLSVLAAVYELWPRFLWATAGLVVLYLVLANGGKVGDLLGQVPSTFRDIVQGPSATGRPPAGNLKT